MLGLQEREAVDADSTVRPCVSFGDLATRPLHFGPTATILASNNPTPLLLLHTRVAQLAPTSTLMMRLLNH